MIRTLQDPRQRLASIIDSSYIGERFDIPEGTDQKGRLWELPHGRYRRNGGTALRGSSKFFQGRKMIFRPVRIGINSC